MTILWLTLYGLACAAIGASIGAVIMAVMAAQKRPSSWGPPPTPPEQSYGRPPWPTYWPD